MKGRILIVDDDKKFLEEISQLLEAGGYEVHTVSDANLAVKEACKLKPDIILLDLKMQVSGFKIAIQLSCLAETKHIPIVAITGVYTEQEHRLVMNACGIQKWLIKPASPLEVIAAIEQAQ